MEDTVPFDVTGDIAVGDLNAVQEAVMPQAQNVKVRVVKAAVKTSKDKDLKSLNCEFKIVDGIQVGEEVKYANKSIFPSFMDLLIWANPETKTSTWYANKQHLLGFKEFCKAMDLDLSGIVVNDSFCASLIGRELTCNIVHEAETANQVNQATGAVERVKTGAMSVRLKNFRKAA